jgi:TetR/AcrR family transcriptional regulator
VTSSAPPRARGDRRGHGRRGGAGRETRADSAPPSAAGGDAGSAPRTRGAGRDRARKRAVILAAAEAEFVDAGYQGASVQAIADRAGVPKANVHYYFGSKAKLYRSVLEDILGLWNGFLADVGPEDDPACVLAGFVRQKLRLAFERPRASRLFAQEILRGAPVLAPDLEGDMRRWFAEKVAVIEAWIEAGRMAPVDPDLLLFTIWATTQHYADFEVQVLALTERDGYDEATIERIGEFLVGLVLAGCGLAPAVPGSGAAGAGKRARSPAGKRAKEQAETPAKAPAGRPSHTRRALGR